jgi:hypothetical protein
MRLVRTAGGRFINVEKIERLVDERGEEAGSWTAICADGKEIPLAELLQRAWAHQRELQHLVTAPPQLPARRLSGSQELLE